MNTIIVTSLHYYFYILCFYMKKTAFMSLFKKTHIGYFALILFVVIKGIFDFILSVLVNHHT